MPPPKRQNTLPKTYQTPLKISRIPKRKGSSPKHPIFSGRLFVSGRVPTTWQILESYHTSLDILCVLTSTFQWQASSFTEFTQANLVIRRFGDTVDGSEIIKYVGCVKQCIWWDKQQTTGLQDFRTINSIIILKMVVQHGFVKDLYPNLFRNHHQTSPLTIDFYNQKP